MSEIFRSPRHFKVWTYTVSHCRLLLRSTKERSGDTRVDVHFGGVDRMSLVPNYHGLTIAGADSGQVGEYQKSFGEIRRGFNLYLLNGTLGSFVVAGVVQTHEDQGEYDDPSYFGHFVGA